MKQESALAKAPRQDLAFEPKNLDDAYRMSKALVASRLLPREVDTPEKALAILMLGREHGIAPMTSLTNIDVIEGRPRMQSALIVAIVLRSGLAEYWQVQEMTAEVATIATKRVGAPEPTVISFTMEQAKTAGLLMGRKGPKANWQKYPEVMLLHRCETRLARAVYPDVVAGLYDTDEIRPEFFSSRPAPKQVEQPPKPEIITNEPKRAIGRPQNGHQANENRPQRTSNDGWVVRDAPKDRVDPQAEREARKEASKNEQGEPPIDPPKQDSGSQILREMVNDAKQRFGESIVGTIHDILGVPPNGQRWTKSHRLMLAKCWGMILDYDRIPQEPPVIPEHVEPSQAASFGAFWRDSLKHAGIDLGENNWAAEHG